MQQTNLFQNTMIKWENSIVQCEGVSQLLRFNATSKNPFRI